MEEPKRVAIYIRWSTEDQGEGTTLEIQSDACRSYIQSQGWAVTDELIFVDDGVSGATVDRPALTRLRRAVTAGRVDCVVVYKLDRLSRSVLDMVKLVLEEWDGRCWVKSAREPIDTLTPTGKMFFYQLMSFAEWERSVIRERMSAGRLRRAMQGRSPGATLPFGYVKGPEGKILLEPAAAATVAQIFRMYQSGLGCRAISRELDRAGVPAPEGGKWGQPTVGRILRNPAYAGTFVYGRQRVKNGRKVTAPEPLVVRDGFFPPIVTQAEFEAVQRLRQERPGVGRPGAGTGRSLGSQNLLSGVLRCGCGRAMTGVSLTARGVQYRYYACGGAHGTGPHLCDGGNIPQETLDRLVVAHLLDRLQEARSQVGRRLSGEVRARAAEAALRRQAAERELQRLQESRRRLQTLFLDGKLDLEEYRGLTAELAPRLAEAEVAAGEAGRAEAEARAALAAEGGGEQRLPAEAEGWSQLTAQEQKLLLRQFVAALVARREKATGQITCQIAWKSGAVDAAGA